MCPATSLIKSTVCYRHNINPNSSATMEMCIQSGFSFLLLLAVGYLSYFEKSVFHSVAKEITKNIGFLS